MSTGWIATVLLMCGITFRSLFLLKSNLWIESSLSSITHTVWPMILFWIILTSISQHQGKWSWSMRRRWGKCTSNQLWMLNFELLRRTSRRQGMQSHQPENYFHPCYVLYMLSKTSLCFNTRGKNFDLRNFFYSCGCSICRWFVLQI